MCPLKDNVLVRTLFARVKTGRTSIFVRMEHKSSPVAHLTQKTSVLHLRDFKYQFYYTM